MFKSEGNVFTVCLWIAILGRVAAETVVQENLVPVTVPSVPEADESTAGDLCVAAPSTVDALQRSQPSYTAVQLRWDYPLLYLPCVEFLVQSIGFRNLSARVNSTEHTFLNFPACSDAEFSIVVVARNGSTGPSVLVDPIQLRIDEPDGANVAVVWQVNNFARKCLERIRVQLDGQEIEASGSAGRISLAKYVRCYFGTIKVQGFGRDGGTVTEKSLTPSWNQPADIFPRDLKLEKQSNEELWLSWSVSINYSATCIESYVVTVEKVLPNGAEIIKYAENVTDTRVRLDVSDICWLQQVGVRANSVIGQSSAEASLVPEQEKIDGLTAEKVHEGEYRISWKEIGCMRSYTIDDGRTVIVTSKPSVILKNISPCKRYNITMMTENLTGAIANESLELAAVQFDEVSFTYSARKLDCNLSLICPPASRIVLRAFRVDGDVETIEDTFVANSNFSYVVKNDIRLYRMLQITPFSRGNIEGFATNITLNPVSEARKAYSAQIPNLCPIIDMDPDDLPSFIGPVRNLEANTDLERTVLLTWRPPSIGEVCLKEYTITWGSNSESISSTRTSFRIEDLEPCLTYNFTVAAVIVSNDKGPPVSISATVREMKQMTGVTELELYETDSWLLSIKWKPPENGTYCVQSYRIAAWYTDDDVVYEVYSNTTADQYLAIGPTIACITYNVQIIPISISNQDGLNEIMSLRTTERVISAIHIGPLQSLNQKSRALTLSTTLRNETNNRCLLISVRYSCVRKGDDIMEESISKDFLITSGQETFDGEIEPLVPYSRYECTAQILNVAGWSDLTDPAEFQTAEDVPEVPQSLRLYGHHRAINMTWAAPAIKNGIVQRYRIHLRALQPEYAIPKTCEELPPYNRTFDLHDELDPDDQRNWNDADFQYTIENLEPFVTYAVQLAAATNAGVGPYSELEQVVTLPAKPDPVRYLHVGQIVGPELHKNYSSSVELGWMLPCHLRGQLRQFVGTLRGSRTESADHNLQWTLQYEEHEDEDEQYSYVEDRLLPEFEYRVSVTAEVYGVGEGSEPIELNFQSPAGIPEIDHTDDWLDVNIMDAPNPTHTARIIFEDIVLKSDIGNITFIALLVSERACQEDPVPRTDLLMDSTWPEILDWHRVNNMRCTAQYQTTPKFWNPQLDLRRSARRRNAIEYIIGDEKCDNGKEYCNGPLKPGTEYALIVRIFSRSGFTDSNVQIFETDSLIQVALILSLIASCLFIAFIGGLVVLWRRQRLLAPTLSSRAPNEEPSDIPMKNFPNQYEELFQSNKEKVTKEYQEISYFSESLLKDTVTFQSAKENEKKNRYINILPYDSNRVLLESTEEDEDINDYINASFIAGYKYQREYIATQGPKPETCYDFWRMILQYEIESIVMLTQLVENDKNKCCQYFPRFNQHMTYGDIRVKSMQEMNLNLYLKRLFIVTKGNQTKAVFHYHFLGWPDHGCPESSTELIKFTKIVRSERKNYAIPLVVHCSAGVGRTGTFIGLDIILQRILAEKKINIYDVVKQLRRQRVKMVQTLEQYTFLYQCCLEYINRNSKKKPKTSIADISSSTDGNANVTSTTGIDNEKALVAGEKTIFNIKFPKSFQSGLGNVKSFAPSDIENGV